MPAIQPTRLKFQVTELAGTFLQPDLFIRVLKDLLEQYSDRTHKPGQYGIINQSMPAFNVPTPVLRQVQVTIRPLVEQNPQLSLALSTSLWNEPYLEFRILAAYILGWIRVKPSQVILDCIHSWISSPVDDQVLTTLLKHGLAQLRLEEPEAVLKQAEEWLGSDRIWKKKAGLLVLESLIQEPKFENLPAIFTLISPFLRKTPSSLRSQVASLLITLLKRSPNESAFILQENLRASDNPDTAWLVRHALAELKSLTSTANQSELSVDLHNRLRETLRQEYISQKEKLNDL